jgi:uncharacterized membrane protein (DUF373 family)
MSGAEGAGTKRATHDESRVAHTTVHRLVRRLLEPAQDALVVALALVIFAVMLRTLMTLGAVVLGPAIAPRAVLGEVLFMLVLVELIRLLVIYLRDHHVSVDVMVEVSLVTTLREISLLGVGQISASQLLALSAFLLVLGVLLRFGGLRIGQRKARRLAFRRPVEQSTMA